MDGLVREARALPGHNLGEGAQNQRLRRAVFMTSLALGLTVLFVQLDFPRLWRVALFFPFMWAAIGAVQGLYRTCPFHVNKRTRVNDAGEVERVCSEAEVSQARCLAHRVVGLSILSALGATALVFFLP
jgi:hypothetical protein